jgi:hypothetical protein
MTFRARFTTSLELAPIPGTVTELSSSAYATASLSDAAPTRM